MISLARCRLPSLRPSHCTDPPSTQWKGTFDSFCSRIPFADCSCAFRSPPYTSPVYMTGVKLSIFPPLHSTLIHFLYLLNNLAIFRYYFCLTIHINGLYRSYQVLCSLPRRFACSSCESSFPRLDCDPSQAKLTCGEGSDAFWKSGKGLEGFYRCHCWRVIPLGAHINSKAIG